MIYILKKHFILGLMVLLGLSISACTTIPRAPIFKPLYKHTYEPCRYIAERYRESKVLKGSKKTATANLDAVPKVVRDECDTLGYTLRPVRHYKNRGIVVYPYKLVYLLSPVNKNYEDEGYEEQIATVNVNINGNRASDSNEGEEANILSGDKQTNTQANLLEQVSDSITPLLDMSEIDGTLQIRGEVKNLVSTDTLRRPPKYQEARCTILPWPIKDYRRPHLYNLNRATRLENRLEVKATDSFLKQAGKLAGELIKDLPQGASGGAATALTGAVIGALETFTDRDQFTAASATDDRPLRERFLQAALFELDEEGGFHDHRFVGVLNNGADYCMQAFGRPSGLYEIDYVYNSEGERLPVLNRINKDTAEILKTNIERDNQR